MNQLPQASLEKQRVLSVDDLVFSTLIIALAIVTFSTVVLILKFGEIDVSQKTDVARNTLGGTLALGAMALTVLGFSVSQMRLQKSTLTRRPYKRIGYIIYFIIPLSMADALTSAVFLMTEDAAVFLFLIVLLYIIVVGVVVSVSLWAIKELK